MFRAYLSFSHYLNDLVFWGDILSKRVHRLYRRLNGASPTSRSKRRVLVERNNFPHPIITHRSLTEPILQTMVNFSCLSTHEFCIYPLIQVVPPRRVTTLGTAEPHSASKSRSFRMPSPKERSPTQPGLSCWWSRTTLFNDSAVFPKWRSQWGFWSASLGKVAMIISLKQSPVQCAKHENSY